MAENVPKPAPPKYRVVPRPPEQGSSRQHDQQQYSRRPRQIGYAGSIGRLIADTSDIQPLVELFNANEYTRPGKPFAHYVRGSVIKRSGATSEQVLEAFQRSEYYDPALSEEPQRVAVRGIAYMHKYNSFVLIANDQRLLGGEVNPLRRQVSPGLYRASNAFDAVVGRAIPISGGERMSPSDTVAMAEEAKMLLPESILLGPLALSQLEVPGPPQA
jgi:hypothetical protein